MFGCPQIVSQNPTVTVFLFSRQSRLTRLGPAAAPAALRLGKLIHGGGGGGRSSRNGVAKSDGRRLQFAAEAGQKEEQEGR